MQGQVIDQKYQIVQLLGQGGMGAVYEARHLGTGRRVAIKVIVSELGKGTDVLARFQREARASGAIESQHVVQVLDSGVDPVSQNPYMVMEHLTGQDLHQLIERVGPIAPDLALRIVAQACLGLARAHEAGIVHRDIKSANIYLARREADEVVVKLLDFGIAKLHVDQFGVGVDHGLTRTGVMMGSPLYMSPEQAMGQKGIDERSDIWSLGVVLYEALTGISPNGECETIGQLIMAICSGKRTHIHDRAPWVMPDVCAILEKAMAQDPRHRYRTAKDMYAAIVPLLPLGDVKVIESMLGPVPADVRAHIAPHPPTPSMDATRVSGSPTPAAPIAGAAISGAAISGAATSVAPISGPVISVAPVSGAPVSASESSGAPVDARTPFVSPHASTALGTRAFGATTASGTARATNSSSEREVSETSPKARSSLGFAAPAAIAALLSLGGAGYWIATRSHGADGASAASQTVSVATSETSTPAPSAASSSRGVEPTIVAGPTTSSSDGIVERAPVLTKPELSAAPGANVGKPPSSRPAMSATPKVETHPPDSAPKPPTVPTADRSM